MQAQLETLHIGAWPYQADFDEPDALFFEDAPNNVGAARMYAVNSGAVTLFTSIGYAAVISGLGVTQVEMKASASYDQNPMLYHSINTTSALNTPTYNINGEQSWGVLQQIEEGWPSYVPKVIGTYVLKKTVEIADLFSYAAGYDATTGKSSVPLP
jgi:nitrilase